MAAADEPTLVVNLRSAASAKLSAVLKGGARKPATGFFVDLEGKMFLISNWHVFSGRDYQTGQCISPDGAEPELVEASYFVSKEKRLLPCEANLPLKDSNGTVLWRQHRTHGQLVDIGALEVSLGGDEAPISLPSWDREPPHHAQPGDDVFVVGFPRGLSLAGGLAIWKRGSVATEPTVPIHGISKFLVDTTTREGMSGSPVFTRQHFVSGKTPNLGLSLTASDLFLLGIYSGRYGDEGKHQQNTELEIFRAQLGVVFSRTYLREILQNGVPGSFVLIEEPLPHSAAQD